MPILTGNEFGFGKAPAGDGGDGNPPNVEIEMWGGGGATGQWAGGHSGKCGGGGGYSYWKGYVEPGTTLIIRVGGGGYRGFTNGTGRQGGYPNGGEGQNGAGNGAGGGAGGMSSVCIGSHAFANALVVAGGGGGGNYHYGGGPTNAPDATSGGGGGGGTSGQDAYGTGTNSTGGTQNSHGANPNSNVNGAAFQGGTGNQGPGGGCGAGGGGGGYYGGAGGYNCGNGNGSGGSGFVATTSTINGVSVEAHPTCITTAADKTVVAGQPSPHFTDPGIGLGSPGGNAPAWGGGSVQPTGGCGKVVYNGTGYTNAGNYSVTVS